MKTISFMIPTYNEVENAAAMCKAVIDQVQTNLPDYDYEVVFIDNCSTDGTRDVLRKLCADNTNLIRLKEKLKPFEIEIYPVSAATTEGIEDLIRAVTAALRQIPELEPFEEEIEEPTPEERRFEIKKTGQGFMVSGNVVEEIIRQVNFGDLDSLNFFHSCLRKSGIIDALREAGAKDGDTVIIDEMEFEFEE